MGIADYLRNAGQGCKFLGRALCVTAGDYDPRFGIFAVYAPDRGTSVVVSRSRNRAGVEDHDLGAGRIGGAVEPKLLELAFDCGAIRLGGAAPKILYVKTGHGLIVPSDWGGPRGSWAAKSRVPTPHFHLPCRGACCWSTMIRRFC